MKKIMKIVDNIKNIPDYKFYIFGISLIMLSILIHFEIGFVVWI